MTEREQFEMNEQRKFIYSRDHYTCICGNPINHYYRPQLAHKIPQTKANLKEHGKYIIHHPMNLRSVCSLKCNKKVDIGTNPRQVEKLAKEIRNEIKNMG